MFDVGALDRPTVRETIALVAAYLAGLHVGFFPHPDRFAAQWHCERRFTPQIDATTREQKLASWAKAARRLLS
jgi:glycerol kinase